MRRLLVGVVGLVVLAGVVWSLAPHIRRLLPSKQVELARREVPGAALLFPPGKPAPEQHDYQEGRVEVDGWSGSWIKVFRRGEGQVKYPPIEGKAQTPNDNFIDAILGRAEAQTSVKNGIIQSELMDAIYESARTGTVARPRARPAAP